MSWPKESQLPRLPRRLLPRPALLARLDEWAPVTILHGPAGIGKTTVVATWLARHPAEDVTAIWVSLTPESSTPGQFAGQLLSAMRAQQLVPPGAAPTATSGVLALLDDELALGPSRRIVVVLDNLTHFRDLVALRDLVAMVQRHRELHLVACTRGSHPLEGIAALAVEVNVLTVADLQLSQAEIVRLGEIVGRVVTVAEAEQLEAAVGGWISLIRLILERSGPQELSLSAAAHYLQDILVEDHGDELLLTCLMRCALAQRLDIRLVAELCDDSDGMRAAALEVPALLEHRYLHDVVVLHFPGLVQAVLRDLYARRDPAAVEATHRRLAQWFAAQAGPQHPSLAFHHAVSGRDWPLVRTLWMEYGATLAIDDLADWRASVAALPHELLTEHPGIAIAPALPSVVADRPDSGRGADLRAYFEACQQIVTQQMGTLGLPDLIYAVTGHMVGLRMHGRYREAIELESVIDARLAASRGEPRLRGDRLSWFQLQSGMTHLLAGSDWEAVRRFQLAWGFATPTTAPFIPAAAASNLALAWAMRGETATARMWISTYSGVEALGAADGPPVEMGAHVARGLLALDRLDRITAQVELAALGDGSASVELWPFIVYLKCQFALQYQDSARMLTRLASVERAHDQQRGRDGAVARLLTRSRVDLLIALGQAQRATELIRRLGEDEPMLRAPLARVHLLAGEFANARGVVADALFDDNTSVRDKGELLVVEALAALRMDDRVAAAAAFGHAYDLYRSSGIVRGFSIVSEGDRAELLELLDGRVERADQDRLRDLETVYPATAELISLTKREKALITELARTSSRQEIAAALFVSVNTIKSQIMGLYHKLGTTSREETLMKVRQLGLWP